MGKSLRNGVIFPSMVPPYPYHGRDWCPHDLGYVGLTAVTGLALSANQSLLYVADYGSYDARLGERAHAPFLSMQQRDKALEGGCLVIGAERWPL